MKKKSLLDQLDKDEKEILVREFRNSPTLRREFIKLLNDKKDVLMKSMVSETLMDEQNWHLKQAGRAGQIKAFDTIMKIFEKSLWQNSHFWGIY